MLNGPFTWYTLSDTFDDFKKGLKLAQNCGAKSLMVLTCTQNTYPEQAFNGLLKTCSLPVFGGIYPRLTHQDTLIEQGALIIGFKEEYQVSVFPDLHLCKSEEALEGLINLELEKNKNFGAQENFLMFYDGLMANVEDFIDCLFECLDHNITIAGGGAGYLDFIQRPCIFTNNGLQSNAVLLVTLPRKITTSIAHGWQIFKGPFLVSEVQDQTIQSLNYQPAFDVYSQAIESASDYKFQTDNFFNIAKNYPLGIEDINNNLIVRDPLLSINGQLQCAGKIPINSMVYLLESNINNLVNAAEEAAISLFSRLTSSTEQTAMVFDCISRVLYMEGEFDKELQVINKHRTSVTLFGVLSIGEIANSDSGVIRLFNKSTVISAW
ncbi:MAG: FIST C-terminal domain-containing protein [Colwellia sp.]